MDNSVRARIVVPYFGILPEWFDLFMLTCSYNPGFEWLVFTDDQTHETSGNVRLFHIDFGEYKERMSSAIGLDVSGIEPYKVSELRPFLGVVHEEEIGGAEFWGYGDIDVLVGDLHGFYDAVLARYGVVTTHPRIVSGHFALFANTEAHRELPFQIPGWTEKVLVPEPTFVDEYGFSKVVFPMVRRFRRYGWRLMEIANLSRWPSPILTGGVYMREMYTTPMMRWPWHDGTTGVDQPLEWTWQNGRAWSVRDNHEVPYIHFMNFKSSRFLPNGTECPWCGMESVVRRHSGDRVETIHVSPAGIETF